MQLKISKNMAAIGLVLLFMGGFVAGVQPVGAQENPFDDSPVQVKKEAKTADKPDEFLELNAAAAAPVGETKKSESLFPASATMEVPLGGVATLTIGPADIIEQAGELICMTGNPVGCLVAVIAGLVKHKDGTALEKASVIGDLAPLSGPIGIVGKAVRYGNYGKIAYENRDKVSEVLNKVTENGTQPPAPVEEREILPLPSDSPKEANQTPE